MLGVSRASAGEMLKRLEEEGLVERGEHKEAILTATGRVRAERAVRKHRIIERLLTDFMGYTAAEAHVHADELGDTFSDDMVERIDERLGHPDRCPHGWPVDTEVEQAENLELAPLVGARARRPARRSSGSPSTTASSCTGSTTRASCRAPRSSSRAAEPAAGPVPGRGSTAARRRSARRRRPACSSAPPDPGSVARPRHGRAQPLYGPASRAARGAVTGAAGLRGRGDAEARGLAERSALSIRSHVKSSSSRPKWPYAAVFA